MNETLVSRAEFIRKLGMGSKALMAFYCIGVVSACTTDDEPEPTQQNPSDGDAGITGTTRGNNVNFTVDLTNAKYAKLKTAGNFEYVDDIIIANAKVGLVALSKICTHAGTSLTYRKDEDDLWCSNHNSEFSPKGTVEKGPAQSNLKVYSATLSADGNTLTIKS